MKTMKEHSNQNVFPLALGATWNRTRVIKLSGRVDMHVLRYYYFIFLNVEHIVFVGFWRLKKLQTWTLYWMGGHIISMGEKIWRVALTVGAESTKSLPSSHTHKWRRLSTPRYLYVLRYVCVLFLTTLICCSSLTVSRKIFIVHTRPYLYNADAFSSHSFDPPSVR